MTSSTFTTISKTFASTDGTTIYCEAVGDPSKPTLVFTHGDLSSFNIMVQDDKVAGIIDWEMSGWLPMYWEYSCAKDAAPLNTFWAEEIDHFLTPMPYEFEMEMIRRRYFGDF